MDKILNDAYLQGLNIPLSLPFILSNGEDPNRYSSPYKPIL